MLEFLLLLWKHSENARVELWEYNSVGKRKWIGKFQIDSIPTEYKRRTVKQFECDIDTVYNENDDYEYYNVIIVSIV